jgi:hypothetical protein
MRYVEIMDDIEDDPIVALQKDENLYPSFVDEGCAGFLLPDGEVLDCGGDSHESIANRNGTSLDELYQAGVARIYASPGDFLGIEIHKSPTQEQVKTLTRAANRGRFERFAIDGPRQEHHDGNITPQIIRRLLRAAFL